MKSETLERITTTAQYDRVMETDKWSGSIPAITFLSDWQIHMVPPFAGAVVRFAVVKGNQYVSVYLDGYDTLGLFGEPYWEIFTPNNDEFPQRCPMNDTESLLRKISYALEEE